MNWEDAAKRSKSRAAISEAMPYTFRGKPVKIRYVKPSSGDPYAVFAYATGLKVPGFSRPSTVEIDARDDWRPY